ncbi:uncharacterized protein LOC135226377 [Macrobrachium nipponense]|uniref:uncharacterized protein LOC135226377 n=1 Tax=Macrobrachium nipponense TaxID=159736 RepID=UPI0030C85578
MCLQPTTDVAVVNSALSQRQHHHSSERERNPILSIDILGLCADELYPPDQEKQELPSEEGPSPGEPDRKQEPGEKSFLDVLDAIDFDEKENGGEVDEKNIDIAPSAVPPVFSAPPEVMTEDDSQFFEKITCIEDLCKFE